MVCFYAFVLIWQLLVYCYYIFSKIRKFYTCAHRQIDQICCQKRLIYLFIKPKTEYPTAVGNLFLCISCSYWCLVSLVVKHFQLSSLSSLTAWEKKSKMDCELYSKLGHAIILKPEQKLAMLSLMEKKDALAVLQTGLGRILYFFRVFLH